MKLKSHSYYRILLYFNKENLPDSENLENKKLT